MAEYDNLLDWKNHNPFFFNLNKDLDEIKEMSKNINKSFIHCQAYYNSLENFMDHYSCYLDIDNIDTSMDEVADVINTTKFDLFLKEGIKDLKNEKNLEYYQEILDSMKSLKAIHRKIIEGIYNNSLWPTVNKKLKKKPGDAVKSTTY